MLGHHRSDGSKLVGKFKETAWNLQGFIYLIKIGHPTPLPYPKECKHFDYGLQHKIAIKRIFEDFKVGPSYYPNNI
mgnify:CR=1 FL=1